MKTSTYESKTPDKKGLINYTQSENKVWQTLYARQMQILPDLACKEYLTGLDLIGLNSEQIPQIPEVNACLLNATGWQITAVPALIDFQTFFELMANKKFPCATFIRNMEELDYLQEPDIFHEIFGHCPLITQPDYAEFMYEYAKLGLTCSHKERVMLARLYWFTIEFGLIKTKDGMRIYGGGILSSHGETKYCLNQINNSPVYKPLDPIEAFRTPYRIDIMQPLYFVINSFHDLFDIIQKDLLSMIKNAQDLGMHAPLFKPKPKPDEAVC